MNETVINKEFNLTKFIYFQTYFFLLKNSIIGDVLKHANKLHFLSHFAIFNCLRM